MTLGHAVMVLCAVVGDTDAEARCLQHTVFCMHCAAVYAAHVTFHDDAWPYDQLCRNAQPCPGLAALHGHLTTP